MYVCMCVSVCAYVYIGLVLRVCLWVSVCVCLCIRHTERDYLDQVYTLYVDLAPVQCSAVTQALIFILKRDIHQDSSFRCVCVCVCVSLSLCVCESSCFSAQHK